MEETFDVVIIPPAFPIALAPIISSALTFVALSTGIYMKIYKESLGFMVFWVNFSDFIYTTTRFIPYIYTPGGNIMCVMLTTLGCYGILSSVICSIFFGNILFLLTTEGGAKKLLTRFPYFIIIATTAPIPFAITTPFWDYAHWDDSRSACVHKSIIGATDWAFTYRITLPITICCVLSVIWYSLASCKLKHVLQNKNIKYLLVLLGYPGIVLVCWFPLLTCNLLIGFGVELNATFYQCMQLLPYLQGSWDALTLGCLKNPIYACSKAKCWSRRRQKDESLTVNFGTGQDLGIQRQITQRMGAAFTPTSSFVAGSNESYMSLQEKNALRKYSH